MVPLPIEEEEAEENFPPFPVGAPQPPTSDFVRYDPIEDGDVMEFVVQGLGDPNDTDRLYYRVFINYSPINRGIVEQGTSEGLAPEQRDQAIRFLLNPCQELRDPNVDVHRIEMIVADRPFLAETPGNPSPNPNQALPPEAGFFRLVWFFRFESQCP